MPTTRQICFQKTTKFSFAKDRAALRLRSAFTLIELLTVIAIIGILASIIIPVTARVRESARTSQCSSNMRQLAQSVLLYAQDNKGVLPATYNNPSGNQPSWWQYLYPDYCSDKGVFKCPVDQTEFSGNPAYTGSFSRDGKTLADGKVSYGIPGSQSDNFKVAGKSLSVFPTPSRMCLFTDFEVSDRRLSQNYAGNKPMYLNEVIFPHNGQQKGNFAFLDAHVVLMSKAEMNAANTDKKYNFGYSAPW